MASTVQRLTERQLVQPPSWLPMNVHYEVVMGSLAYGVADAGVSDMDIYGFCVPPKEVVFPHLAGVVFGFDKQFQRFEQWQQHRVQQTPEVGKPRVYDLTIYNIVNYFRLCADNNPNMIDSLFVPQDCILHTTSIGNLVRESRRLFLHKGCWPKFKGYAYSQLHKIDTKQPEGKRKEIVEKFGYDVKFAYHVVRLLDECEQILSVGDLDLRRAAEHMKAVRRGDVTLAEIKAWFAAKELHLEKLCEASSLPWGPDEPKIKALLLQCLEQHYGSLDKCVVDQTAAERALREIRDIAERALTDSGSGPCHRT